MSNSNYRELTDSELREYVKLHPQDEEAFQHCRCFAAIAVLS
ncbi:DUF6887 family protein [Nostoc sp. CCY0012]